MTGSRCGGNRPATRPTSGAVTATTTANGMTAKPALVAERPSHQLLVQHDHHGERRLRDGDEEHRAYARYRCPRRTSDRSTNGLRCRVSTTMKRQNAPAATANTITTRSRQAPRRDAVMENSSAKSVTTDSSAPTPSNRS